MAQTAIFAPVRSSDNIDTRKVIRVCTFSVPTFGLFKDFQREQEAKTGEQLSNSEALTLIITEHARLTAQEGK